MNAGRVTPEPPEEKSLTLADRPIPRAAGQDTQRIPGPELARRLRPEHSWILT
jgi:hypothetical protein